ncbi:MAG: hypothetical protein CMF25_02490 [Kangiellaceae bacterium]|jgi:prefoldin subunit 5|nr:hypothetical protein [Kangiellaceae bacterium]|tara:strand:- start:3474 stop:3989 length:516 start_codon:yes stop_codon:yes gene_type:complete
MSLHTHRELLDLLNVAVAQLHHAQHDANQAVGSLSDNFAQMAGFSHQLKQQLDSETEQNDSLQDISHQISDRAQNSVIALQFYDRLGQRIEHVADSITELAKLLDKVPPVEIDEEKWSALNAAVYSKYSMKEERLIHEQIANGASIQEALSAMKALVEQDAEDDDDDIELF